VTHYTKQMEKNSTRRKFVDKHAGESSL